MTQWPADVPRETIHELTAADVAEMIDNNQLTAARRVLTSGTQQSSSVLALDVVLALLDRNGGDPVVQIVRVRHCLRRGLG